MSRPSRASRGPYAARQTGRPTAIRQTDYLSDRQTDSQSDSQPVRKTDHQSDRQTDRPPVSQTESPPLRLHQSFRQSAHQLDDSPQVRETYNQSESPSDIMLLEAECFMELVPARSVDVT